MRACPLATRLARIEGLREPKAVVVDSTTLLRFVGCTATSLEYAQAFGGDDVRVRGRDDQVDATVPAAAPRRTIGRDASASRATRLTPPGEGDGDGLGGVLGHAVLLDLLPLGKLTRSARKSSQLR